MQYLICHTDPHQKQQWPSMRRAHGVMPQQPKFRVLFIFPQDELTAMAANLAYVQGQSATDADPTAAPAVSRWMDLEDDGNRPIVQDALNLALAEVEDALSAIAAGRLDAPRHYDVHVSPKRELVSEFIMAAGTSDAAIAHLQQAVRQYLIESVLSRWAALTRPDAVAYWTAQAAAHLDAVRDAGRRCMACPKTVRKWPSW